ncbi:U-box domain-containing protein 52-like [Rosa rugosa]|uniref:U-box domain-containing protein 52-like n=1 Tax=Rosa rugosa TaxID=74645 RepID=UPI002B404F35|nr:U-box domain-containing protein 52-like [Rosa rugosa]
MARSCATSDEKREEVVAVAIDKDKGSQYALKWTVEHLLVKGQSLTLVHVKQSTPGLPNQTEKSVSGSELKEEGIKLCKSQSDAEYSELFLPLRTFCKKKLVRYNEVIVKGTDVAKALVNFISTHSIEVLVLAAPSKSGFFRCKRAFNKTTDIPSRVSKGAPDFCTVYVIGKGKISHVQTATTKLPPEARNKQIHNQLSNVSDSSVSQFMSNQQPRASERTRTKYRHRSARIDHDTGIKTPFTRGQASSNRLYEISPDSDVSFTSSGGRPSIDHMFPSICGSVESGMHSQQSFNSDDRRTQFKQSYSRTQFIDMNSSLSSTESGKSWSSRNMEEVEDEMMRLKLELKQTMEVYNTACKETLTSKQKQLDRWKWEEERRLERAHLGQEFALALVQKEEAKCRAAMDAERAAKRIAELEAEQRRNSEIKGLKEAEKRTNSLGGRSFDPRYRKYTIEEIKAATNSFSKALKIGEGGYGPVYVGELDHTQVAIKALRPDAAQGRSQFQQEIEVLSCIRHPNMVLLLGACPEYGCLIYEYMGNGSLEDRLFRRGNTPVIPWQLRFRIAAEIATGLLFLHQAKPEPFVHRDLKPGNILLDYNYVSKISDVGLARLVPPSVADSFTQYHMTSAAGTFCYIDPEYQQTGLLGTKSDIYSLGVMLLQIITAKPAMGLTHLVEHAIEIGTFAEMLDPAVPDWPVEEALKFAKLALQCAEMRRKDRPDLGKVVLPELNRLRELGEKGGMLNGGGAFLLQKCSVSTKQEVMNDPQSGYASSVSNSSTSSYGGRIL